MKELKKNLRKEMIELRKKLPVSVKSNFSQRITEQIEKLEIFKEARNILLYWSMEDEVETHDLANRWKDIKNIILPVIADDVLILKKYTGKLKKHPATRFNLLEPDGEETISPDLIDLVIVPGLAFDRDNNRLGYGKGYYDKLLANMQVYKIGICFHFQMFDQIPHTENDIKMDLILTN